MFSEGGKISHKRVISVCATVLIIFMGAYATFNYKEFVVHIFDWVIVFILVMSGVATIPQILALLRGTPLPKDDTPAPKPADKPEGEADGGSKPGDEGRPDKP